ncbi:MAG: hypothetical protein HY925_01725, partial [Elusimicrobia bacterium]|nr:hypothetical protein [Elusimicrobiota bacterium]
IMAGTATIQGNAFSVGGSTFAVTGGNVGILTTSPATTLDIQGSAQVGSGVLKSTFTAAPGAGTYALNLSSGVKVYNGGPLELTSGGYVKWADGSTLASSDLLCVEIDSKAFTGASEVNFDNLSSSTDYKLIWNFIQNTTNQADMLLRVGGVSSSVYRWSIYSAGYNSGFYFGDLESAAKMTRGYSAAFPPGYVARGSISFSSEYGNPSAALGTMDASVFLSCGYISSITSAFRYAGTSAWSSLKLYPTAGTWTGMMKLFRCGRKW